MKYIISNSDNKYFYTEQNSFICYIPEVLAKAIENVSNNEYYDRKFFFWKECGFFNKEKIKFNTQFSDEDIKGNLSNLRQLLIETTDKCNLDCFYCAYGELYSNHDVRHTRIQNFSIVKKLIDFLSKYWESIYNTSFEKKIVIGFYGGEPLLNFKLIKETVEYLKSLNLKNIDFVYNITTNAICLDKCIDFLVENNFNILISLDGDKRNSIYRKSLNNKDYFNNIINTIHNIQNKYPAYFEKKIAFNAVLHDKNSVKDVYLFIKNEFNKIPHIAELNPSGIAESKQKLFASIFKNKYESYLEADKELDLSNEFDFVNPESSFYNIFIRDFSGNYYESYVNLFDRMEDISYYPTGTCLPFRKKIFLTVNGKILPCEKVGHKHILQTIGEDDFLMNFNNIGNYYTKFYNAITKQCVNCLYKKSCGQCVFSLEMNKEELECPRFADSENLTEYFNINITIGEANGRLYEKIMTNIIND